MQQQYEYRVVPFVGSMEKGIFDSEGPADVSKKLASIINSNAKEGWEFYQMGTVNVVVSPGCVAGLLGSKNDYFHLDQLVFRMKVNL